MSVITDNAAIDGATGEVMETRADNELRRMLGPKYFQTSELERALFTAGYRMGHIAGHGHGLREAREIVFGKDAA